MDIKLLFDKAKNMGKSVWAHALQHKVIVSCVAAATVMAMLMSAVIVKSNDVKIYVDGELVKSFTAIGGDIGAWLESADVDVYDGDKVTSDNANIYIDRAFYVTVKADGVNTTLKTTDKSVSDIIAQAGVTVSADDIVTPARDEVVSASAVIEISRVTSDTETVTEKIKFETKKEETDSLYVGQSEVVTEGKNGEKEYVYKVTYTDGKETARELISETVTKEPVDKVIKVGTKKKAAVTTSATPTSYKKMLTMRATAYTYGDDGGNRTCTGVRPYKGIVAVDPSVIPLGTKLYIETSDGKYIYGNAVAADIGGAINGNKIDVFLESNSECRAFGRRTVNVYILD